MTVHCPELVALQSKAFTPLDDAHLRANYRPGLRVDPAQLALRLRKKTKQVENRLSELKLRNKRQHV